MVVPQLVGDASLGKVKPVFGEINCFQARLASALLKPPGI
jgi:hypothetical protein